MADRLLIVFTRLVATKGNGDTDEFLEVWQQQNTDLRWWPSSARDGRQVLVMHGNSSDYPAAEAPLVEEMLARMTEALKTLALPAEAREIGIAIHGSESVRERVENRWKPPAVFVSRYSDGKGTFAQLAGQVHGDLDFAAAFDDKWRSFQDKTAIAGNLLLGEIRHSLAKAYAPLVQDMRTWRDAGFSRELAVEIAHDHALRPMPSLAQLRETFHAGSKSVRAIVVSEALRRDPDVAMAWKQIRTSIPKDAGAALPIDLAGLLKAVRNADDLVTWRNASPHAIDDLSTWWVSLHRALDTIMGRLVAAPAHEKVDAGAPRSHSPMSRT